MSECCCDGGKWVKQPLGNDLFVVTKCLPRALDLGHCGDEDHPETEIVAYCCRFEKP